MRTTASVTSGPMPSPGISVIVCFIRGHHPLTRCASNYSCTYQKRRTNPSARSSAANVLTGTRLSVASSATASMTSTMTAWDEGARRRPDELHHQQAQEHGAAARVGDELVAPQRVTEEDGQDAAQPHDERRQRGEPDRDHPLIIICA